MCVCVCYNRQGRKSKEFILAARQLISLMDTVPWFQQVNISQWHACCRSTFCKPAAQTVIHRALRTLIAAALTGCLPCGSGILQFMRMQQLPAGHQPSMPHTNTQSRTAGSEGDHHAHVQRSFLRAPASTPQSTWAYRFLRDDHLSSAAGLRELLQLNSSGSHIDGTATEKRDVCGPENALIPFAVVALGQPLCELLCISTTSPDTAAPWASVLSVAAGMS